VNTQPILFDKCAFRYKRERAASGFAAHDFLKVIAAERIAEKLEDTLRTFTHACDVGAHYGQVIEAVAALAKVQDWTALDVSPSMVKILSEKSVSAFVADEEWLPLAQDHFQLITSALGLHHANDLAGVFAQMKHALAPDGLLLAVVYGGQTLKELRDVLERAEIEVTGGVSPRVLPFVDVRDAGDVLARIGFELPVADSEVLTVSYTDMFALMREIRGMGETNTLVQRFKGMTRREVFLRAAQLYQQDYSDEEGRITATVELVTCTGWKPSGTVRLS
jgi:NADH dehydrogenase [ubiquinone] 1 alpha subcomplex assembly factor 5